MLLRIEVIADGEYAFVLLVEFVSVRVKERVIVGRRYRGKMVGVSSIIYFSERDGVFRGRGEVRKVLVVGVIEELLFEVEVGVGHR